MQGLFLVFGVVKRFYVAATQHVELGGDFFIRPVPPFEFQKHGPFLFGKAIADMLGRKTSHNGVVVHVFGDNGSCTDYGTIPNVNAGHNHSLGPNPDIIAYDCVTLAGKTVRSFAEFWHVVKGKGAGPVHPVSLISCHDKAHTRANGAKRTNFELVNVCPVRAEVACAVLKVMPVVIAGIIAVPSSLNVLVLYVLSNFVALKRAVERIFSHCFSPKEKGNARCERKMNSVSFFGKRAHLS